jgi:two-component system NarL family sensor kinase
MKYTQLGSLETLEQPTKTVLYRILQELTNNAVKHANAKLIFVQLGKHDKGITLIVEDNGQGFDKGRIIKGAGLQNVQSRVDYLKGSMEINSIAGEGSTINIEIPL